MKVILAGYPKTGTKTLRQAFLDLGYSNYDWLENCMYLRKEWTKIITEGGTTEDFRRMYENVDTVTDMPCYYFWQEIHEAFPDAKIILTQRDEDQWFKSLQHQVGEFYTIIHRILPYLSPTSYQYDKLLEKLAYVVFGTYGTRPWFGKNEFPEFILKGKYRRHNAHVLKCAPPDKLLVYDIKEGWEPLCAFLEVPVPDKPFPHKNKGGTIAEEWVATHPYFLQMQKEMMITLTCGSLVSAFGFYYFYKAFKGSPLGFSIW